MNPNELTSALLLNHENPLIRNASAQRLIRLIDLGAFMLNELTSAGFLTGSAPDIQAACENAIIKAIQKNRYEIQQRRNSVWSLSVPMF